MKKLFFYLFILFFIAVSCSPAPRYTRIKNGSKSSGKKTSKNDSKNTETTKIEPNTKEVLEKPSPGTKFRGIASFYGKDYDGKKTSNGEVFDMNGFTAASNDLPFNTWVEIKNLSNDRTVIVRINDRGPFVEGRIIDLSYGAAKELRMIGKGLQEVEITVLY